MDIRALTEKYQLILEKRLDEIGWYDDPRDNAELPYKSKEELNNKSEEFRKKHSSALTTSEEPFTDIIEILIRAASEPEGKFNPLSYFLTFGLENVSKEYLNNILEDWFPEEDKLYGQDLHQTANEFNVSSKLSDAFEDLIFHKGGNDEQTIWEVTWKIYRGLPQDSKIKIINDVLKFKKKTQ